ncbi:16S rRNA (guanine(527)-N(7))-methyltransferase RsmG [Ihubacter massiliensis]|uniref:Ribosomal RNA small subunit methyltransferase G n=1 Tax=Hominibacterium faecale TaxID=2839743 RepID=A0A9J6QRX2_9FIRM|nr:MULTISPECIES: 16S rRNA (guanine(527)-N(7))-methyltransferase RsmG [Eubacteriales Family XIII. Incertae Sedis]MCO7123039.1 16S rRNA (guanine(527)-N(7))-methyltransferase RsmG [Ihubacter massiliensis]MCU7377299.1 16S rRNA (guanine(527)-N(7))-methyltransferase RsmG [Hominibacterium faecale]
MKQLVKAFEELKINYDDILLKKYETYMEGILKWNEAVNLTSITEPSRFIQKHYIDSLLSVIYKEFQNAELIIDVGTGGGFPGIPLALAAPDKKFVLIDSLNKRIKIIKELCGELEIDNVTAIHGRAEELARNKNHRQKYDLCVSRAVANMATLSEYCLPFIRRGGWFLAYKGPNTDEEIKESANALRVLGGKIRREEHAKLSNFNLEHKIIFIEKTGDTPSKYPRKAGTPSKDPLK